MNLYAESSAVLAWLLDEDSGPEIRELLGAAEIIITSDLTLVECDRTLIRGVALRELTEVDAADRRAQLAAAAAHWHVLRIAQEIIDRARHPFPGEPMRTLDALHLSSVLAARSAIRGVGLLSLDERVRRAARKLGLEVLPH